MSFRIHPVLIYMVNDMTVIRSEYWLNHLSNADMNLCLLFNRSCKYAAVAPFFTRVSRLGDGVFWYSLIITLPVIYGSQALQASLHMLLTGIAGLAVYKIIKQATGRRRPCNMHEDIFLATAPLDYYSFPSGHTLHAVSFTIVVTHYYPEMGLICIPFAVCVALSRVILGLHYPTDVIAGAVLGSSLAISGIQLI